MIYDGILCNLLRDVIGAETLIITHQNSARPALPYWTVRATSQREIGWAEYSQGVDSNGDQKIDVTIEATLQVQRIGEDSDIVLADFRDNLKKTTELDKWRAQKIVLFDVGDILDVPFKKDNDYIEPRAIMDLFIRFGRQILDRVGIIDTANINSKFVTNQVLSLDISNVNPDLNQQITVIL